MGQRCGIDENKGNQPLARDRGLRQLWQEMESSRHHRGYAEVPPCLSNQAQGDYPRLMSNKTTEEQAPIEKNT